MPGDAARWEGASAKATTRDGAASEADRVAWLLDDVREGLDRGEFIPAYQPIVALPDRRLIAFEALARWRRPEGLSTPGAFAPALEHPVLSRRISEAVAEAVIRDAAALRRAGLPFGRMGVNLAPSQLGDALFAERLLGALEAAGLEAEDLAVEITETTRMPEKGAPGFAALERLAAAGSVVALDDFGTGYASLIHLRMPFVSTVKLDLSFTRALPEDRAVRAIIIGLAATAKELGMRLVAEGVENAAVEACLVELGCTAAQGYFYAKPAPFAEMEAALRSGGQGAYARP